MKQIEVEDWVYDGLIEKCRVLGYESINDLIVDEILRRAVPLVYRKDVGKFIWTKLKESNYDYDSLVDSIIDEVVISAIDRFGHLVTSIELISGTVFELLILSVIEKITSFEYVYKGVQMGLGLKRGSIDTSKIFGMPDIVFGENGEVLGVIEAKKQNQFKVDENDKYKLKYFAKKGLKVLFMTTASEPKKSAVHQELLESGVNFAFARSYGDIVDTISEI